MTSASGVVLARGAALGGKPSAAASSVKISCESASRALSGARLHLDLERQWCVEPNTGVELDHWTMRAASNMASGVGLTLVSG